MSHSPTTLAAPADDFRPAPGERVVCHYRRDVTRRLLKILLPASIPTALGILIVGHFQFFSSLPYRAPPDAQIVLERESLEGSALLPPPTYAPPPEPTLGYRLWMAFGLILIAAGPGIAIVGLRRVMRTDDEYLLLTTAGLLHRVHGDIWRVPWEDVEEVEVDPAGARVGLQLRDGEVRIIRERFADIDASGLAERLKEVRRKGLWGTL